MTEPSQAASAIETFELSKQFGPVKALDCINVRVRTGEAVALFGANGAGKTTLIRILSLSLRPASGRFEVAGLDPRKQDRAIRQQIGVISHNSFLYPDLTAAENLEFFARLYGVSNPRDRCLELLEQADLLHRSEDPVRTYSRGMQQRVSVARALVHDPSIILLDEPFTGLDPYAAERLGATLNGLREKGRTFLLTTHNLRQGLDITDRWLLLSRGRLVEQGISAQTQLSQLEASCFRRPDSAGSRAAGA